MTDPALTDAERLYSNKNQFGPVVKNYSYSFSGADAKSSVFFSQRPDLITRLDTLHTVSVSVHESKAQVRALGYRGTKGLTRSSRTI